MIPKIKVRGKQPLRDWPNFNWERTSREIIEETGLTPESISKLRRNHAPKTVGKYTSKKTRVIKWELVNWARKNKDIAEELKVEPSFVSQKRRKFAPDTVQKKTFLRI